MESLFDPASRAALVARVERLRPDAPRQWGTMDAGQALAHLVVSMELATGERTLGRVLIGRLIGRLVLGKVLSDKPWGRGAPTHKTFVVHGARDLAAERTRLLALLRRFGEGGPERVTRAPHPFFGRLTPAQWDLLQWRHVDHHLRQFGA